MVYAERIMALLDRNPGRYYTLKEIQEELCLPIRQWEPTLYRALRVISKMEGYSVKFERRGGEYTNHITASYASNQMEIEQCQTKQQ